MSLLDNSDQDFINNQTENKMTNKLPTIDIKGKDYVQVKDRVIFFNEKYDAGMIQTKLVSEPDAQMVVMMAKVTPDISSPERYFTGYSQAKWGDGMVNTSAAMENAETSAVGRALGMMGIGVIESIASADEMTKATSERKITPENDVMERYNQEQLDTVCKDCGASNKRYSTGKVGCSEFCWKKK